MSALSACFPPQVVSCLPKLILGQQDKTISFGNTIVVHPALFCAFEGTKKNVFCSLLASLASRAFHRHDENTKKMFANNISRNLMVLKYKPLIS